MLEIFEFQPQQPPGAIPWNKVGLTHISFNVRNLQGWYDYLVSKGVECLSKPERSPRGHSFFFAKDFDGNLIELMDLGYMYYVLGWLGPLGGWIFRRGMYKSITRVGDSGSGLGPDSNPDPRIPNPGVQGVMRRRLLVSSLLIALPVTFIAQAGPAFDVISIKPNRTNQGIPVVAFQPGGRMIAGNVVVRQVIEVAYGLEDRPARERTRLDGDGALRHRGQDRRRHTDQYDSPDAARDAGRSIRLCRSPGTARAADIRVDDGATGQATRRSHSAVGSRVRADSTAGGSADTSTAATTAAGKWCRCGFGSFFRPTNLSGDDAGP